MTELQKATDQVLAAARLNFTVYPSAPDGYVLIKWDDLENLQQAMIYRDNLLEIQDDVACLG